MPLASEIAQVTGNAFAHQLLMGVVAELPVIASFDAREISSDKILSLALVALPTGRFLNLGEGYTSMQTDTALGEYNASRIGGSVKVQISTEEKWNRNNRSSIGAGLSSDYFSIQAMGAVKAQLRHVQRQIFSGVSNDAKGFPGLKALTPFIAGNTLTTTDTAQDSGWLKTVLNVAGSTSTTASSIYMVKFGEQHCQLCIGGNGGMADFLKLPTPERVWQEYTDAVDSATKSDWFHIATNEGYIGMSLMGSNEANASRKYPQFSVRRAANVTADSGKTCTDDLLGRLRSSFPDGAPDAIYMSFRSRDQLQASRSPSSTVYVGGVLPGNSSYNRAPVPDNFEGIPIIATDAIGNTDAIES